MGKVPGGGILPPGYTQVDWIKPDNSAAFVRLSRDLTHISQYDDTDVINLQVYGFEAVFEPTTDTPPSTWQIMLGGRSAFNSKFSAWINLTNNYHSVGFGSNGANDFLYRGSIFPDEEHTLRWDNGIISLDGVESSTFRPEQSTTWHFVCLFCCWQAGSAFVNQRYVGKIKYAKFWDINGDMLWEGIPCRKDATGEYGFYDIHGDFFHGNAGAAGPSRTGGYDE